MKKLPINRNAFRISVDWQKLSGTIFRAFLDRFL